MIKDNPIEKWRMTVNSHLLKEIQSITIFKWLQLELKHTI